MTAITSSLVVGISTNTDAFNFCKAISGALDSVGVAQDTDITGQIDLSTGSITIPAIAAYAYALVGFQIRKLTSPSLGTLYVRVNYYLFNSTSTAVTASNAGSSTYICGIATIYIGKTVDSSGNLGTVSGYPILIGSSTTSSGISPGSTARPLYIASDGANYLTACCDPGRIVTTPGYTCGAGCFERTIDPATGLYTSDGVTLVDTGASYSTSTIGTIGGTSAINLSANTITSARVFTPQFPSTLYSNSGTGSSAVVFPATVCMPAPFGPMKAGVGYYYSDIAGGSQFTASMYGQNHNYLATGYTYYAFAQSLTSASTSGFGAHRLALLFE